MRSSPPARPSNRRATGTQFGSQLRGVRQTIACVTARSAAQQVWSASSSAIVIYSRMARPRTSTDAEILERIATAVGASDSGWTLAGAAEAAGVHPATLIKRFGSREDVLLALSRRWVDAVPTGPAGRDPYGELMAWAASLSLHGSTPAAVLGRIDMLAEDLRNAQLRDLLHLGWQRQLDHLAVLVEAAVDRGALRVTTPPRLVARLLMDTASGALLRAAVAPDPAEADPCTAVHDLLEALA
jgi:AcrR family transcriptional regulator